MGMDDSLFGNGRRPVYLVALLSFALVMVAFASDPVLNRDGMYYVDTARAMLAGGAGAEHEWLFFPALLAGIASALSVDPVWVAQGYSVLTSVLLSVCLFVWLFRSGTSATPWLALLIALTVPWVLEYQAYVIRDSAAWLALVASLMLARLQVSSRRWRWLLLMVPVALAGFLFRTEMILLLVVPAWLVLMAAWRRGPKVVLPVLIGALLSGGLALLLTRDLIVGHVTFYLDAINSKPEFMLLPEFVASLEPHVNPYVRSELSSVLIAGLLVLPLTGIAGLLGIYLLPLVMGLRQQASAVLRRDDGTSAVMLLVFFSVVLSFLFVMQFVVGRYLVPVTICLMPWVYLGMENLQRGYPRAFRVFVLLAVASALSASFSSGGSKQYLRDAGEYVADNRQALGVVYFTDARAAFYAGARYRPKQQVPLSLADPETVQASQTLVLVVDDDADLQASLEAIEQQFGFSRVLFEADNDDDKGILVISR